MTTRSRRRRLRSFALLAMIAFAGSAGLGLADEPPRRVVSLNLCTDELLLRLADRANIASVTWMARDDGASNVAGLASEVPINHGLAEEVIPLGPDLVLAGQFTTRTAVGMIKLAGVRVAEFGIPGNLDDVRAEIRRMAELVAAPARGEAMIATMDLRLTVMGPPPTTGRPTAVVFNPNGFTVGKGTLVDDIMTRAGLDNIAGRADLGNYSQVPLEMLVTSGVDVLILGEGRGGSSSLATDLLRHPVLARLGRNTRVISIPSRLWTCSGPGVIDAIALLREVADDVRQRGAKP